MKAATPYSLSRLPRWVQVHIENLQRDKMRLDWLETHPFMAYRGRDPETLKMDGHFTLVDEDRTPRVGIVKPTLRQALDAAGATLATLQPPTVRLDNER